jgi:hypothetical protein
MEKLSSSMPVLGLEGIVSRRSNQPYRLSGSAPIGFFVHCDWSSSDRARRKDNTRRMRARPTSPTLLAKTKGPYRNPYCSGTASPSARRSNVNARSSSSNPSASMNTYPQQGRYVRIAGSARWPGTCRTRFMVMLHFGQMGFIAWICGPRELSHLDPDQLRRTASLARFARPLAGTLAPAWMRTGCRALILIVSAAGLSLGKNNTGVPHCRLI